RVISSPAAIALSSTRCSLSREGGSFSGPALKTRGHGYACQLPYVVGGDGIRKLITRAEMYRKFCAEALGARAEITSHSDARVGCPILNRFSVSCPAWQP